MLYGNEVKRGSGTTQKYGQRFEGTIIFDSNPVNFESNAVGDVFAINHSANQTSEIGSLA